jgi:hypothetical protein
MRRVLSLLVIAGSLSYFLICADEPVFNLLPPQFVVHDAQRVSLFRSLRSAGPYICTEELYRKNIGYNYGHGDGEWALAYGASLYVAEQLIKRGERHNINENTLITIIGGGISALMSAYIFLEKGYKNIQLIADNFKPQASYAPVCLSVPRYECTQEDQRMIEKHAVKTYQFYKEIFSNPSHEFKPAIRNIPAYCFNRDEAGLEPLIDAQLLKEPTSVVVDFGNDVDCKMVVYEDNLFVDTALFMNLMIKHLKALNVRFIKEKVTSIAQLKGRYIINCAGGRASSIVKKDQVHPLQSHYIILKNQPRDMTYMLCMEYSKGYVVHDDWNGDIRHQQIRRSMHIFPGPAGSRSCIIGGTRIERGTPEIENDEEFRILWSNAYNFCNKSLKIKSKL